MRYNHQVLDGIHSMIPKKVLFTAVCLFMPVLAPAQDASDEEVVSLSPFTVSSEEDHGYEASSTLAGTRMKTNLKDIASSISVVTKEFLQDTRAAIPQVPITIVKKADALVIQFAVSGTTPKADARN